MNESETFETYRGVVVPESVLVKIERAASMGDVPGLDDEELADLDELERAVMRAEWAEVLKLPVNGRQGWARPDIDEDGLAWGAFGSVDFEKTTPGFDKARYKAEKLREQLKDTLILFEIVRRRLPKRPVALMLKYLRMGILDLEHISDFDSWQLGTLYLRARHLRKQITELEEACWRRTRRRAEAFWASLG